ncbi:MAG: hypothetical protein ACE5IB_01980 [Candidatus Geothermarchaeales archaeon]
MIGHKQIAGGVLLILALLGLSIWSQVVVTYVAVSDAQVTIPAHVQILEVRIPKLTPEDSQATVGVLVGVENPSAISIIVFSITYAFYMDNLTDTRTFWEKERDIFVGTGGFYEGEGGFEVPARSARQIWANLTVDGDRQPQALERLNTSFSGRYYPILFATMLYRFPEMRMVGIVRGLSFSTFQGVVPNED